MSFVQMELDLFELERVQKLSRKEAIYQKLKHYGVDDYYRENIKGKCMLLRIIHDKLNAIPNYKEYLSELINELKKIAPTLPYMESFTVNYSCIIEDAPHPRYYCYRGKANHVGSNSPLFCLEAIPDEFFLGGEYID